MSLSVVYEYLVNVSSLFFRVLLERLIVNRPHPWGLLITFIELIKNPAFKFWSHDFVHCAPEIEKYVACLICDVWEQLLLWRLKPTLMSFPPVSPQAVSVCRPVLHGTEAGPAGDGGHRCQLACVPASS